MENHMGENGLSAEEEYKRGHYTCGVYELSPSPPCARVAPHEIPRHIHSLLDVPSKPPSLASTARDSPGVHLDERTHDRP